MGDTQFLHLNPDWNADPNAPEPKVSVSGSDVSLLFRLNPWGYQAAAGEQGKLSFGGCSRWRLGETNDHGWYDGQCRYSLIAPRWGELYEIVGDDPLAHAPKDWTLTHRADPSKRHFLFYLHDETFECFADDWAFSRSR